MGWQWHPWTFKLSKFYDRLVFFDPRGRPLDKTDQGCHNSTRTYFITRKRVPVKSLVASPTNHLISSYDFWRSIGIFIANKDLRSGLNWTSVWALNWFKKGITSGLGHSILHYWPKGPQQSTKSFDLSQRVWLLKMTFCGIKGQAEIILCKKHRRMCAVCVGWLICLPSACTLYTWTNCDSWRICNNTTWPQSFCSVPWWHWWVVWSMGLSMGIILGAHDCSKRRCHYFWEASFAEIEIDIVLCDEETGEQGADNANEKEFRCGQIRVIIFSVGRIDNEWRRLHLKMPMGNESTIGWLC